LPPLRTRVPEAVQVEKLDCDEARHLPRFFGKDRPPLPFSPEKAPEERTNLQGFRFHWHRNSNSSLKKRKAADQLHIRGI